MLKIKNQRVKVMIFQLNILKRRVLCLCHLGGNLKIPFQKFNLGLES